MKNIRYRKQIRLKEYDYSRSAVYFITICTYKVQPFFGTIGNNDVVLSRIGEIAKKNWIEIPDHFANVRLDEFIVMPNHIHGIIFIVENDEKQKCRGVQLNTPTTDNYFSKISPQKGTISVIIRTYKSSVTLWCRLNGFQYFQWQRSFYDHIIRGEKQLQAIRQYIADNPQNWHLDPDNLILKDETGISPDTVNRKNIIE